MNDSLDVLLEVPCFKCLFWKSERENQTSCNPNDCDLLTEWLLKKVEEAEKEKGSMLLELKTKG